VHGRRPAASHDSAAPAAAPGQSDPSSSNGVVLFHLDRLAVDVEHTADHLDAVARQADHPLDVVDVGAARVLRKTTTSPRSGSAPKMRPEKMLGDQKNEYFE